MGILNNGFIMQRVFHWNRDRKGRSAVFLHGAGTRLFLIAIALLINQCTMPGSPDRHPIAISITPMTSAQRIPDNLVIEINNDDTINPVRNIKNPESSGSVHFSLPKGLYYISVNGITNGLRTLYGFNECVVEGEKASVIVPLRNIITIPVLSDEEETIFIENTPPSPIWEAQPPEGVARCFTSNNSVVMRTSVATTRNHLFFHCEIDDPLDFTNNRLLSAIGEMTADAVIIYTCKITPHDLSKNNAPYPAARVQCETGRAVLNSGLLILENFTTSENISKTILECNDDAITARATRIEGLRILELRILRSLLALPPYSEGDPPRAIVIRYRNGNNGELSDWQTGSIINYPPEESASWGYLDIMQ
jgi:hypothetical protein